MPAITNPRRDRWQQDKARARWICRLLLCPSPTLEIRRRLAPQLAVEVDACAPPPLHSHDSGWQQSWEPVSQGLKDMRRFNFQTHLLNIFAFQLLFNICASWCPANVNPEMGNGLPALDLIANFFLPAKYLNNFSIM